MRFMICGNRHLSLAKSTGHKIAHCITRVLRRFLEVPILNKFLDDLYANLRGLCRIFFVILHLKRLCSAEVGRDSSPRSMVSGC
jgi:hypothetical protein